MRWHTMASFHQVFVLVSYHTTKTDLRLLNHWAAGRSIAATFGKLLDDEDRILLYTTGRRHNHLVAYFMAQQCFPYRRFIGNTPGTGIRFIRSHERVVVLAVIAITQEHD